MKITYNSDYYRFVCCCLLLVHFTTSSSVFLSLFSPSSILIRDSHKDFKHFVRWVSSENLFIILPHCLCSTSLRFLWTQFYWDNKTLIFRHAFASLLLTGFFYQQTNHTTSNNNLENLYQFFCRKIFSSFFVKKFHIYWGFSRKAYKMFLQLLPIYWIFFPNPIKYFIHVHSWIFLQILEVLDAVFTGFSKHYYWIKSRNIMNIEYRMIRIKIE